jgi:hypothetical protein
MNLVQSGEISTETAISQASNPEQMTRFLERMKI